MIRLDDITADQHFGRFFLTLPNAPGLLGYYRTLDALRSFLRSDAWESSVAGFYLSATPDANGVRISYFTERPQDTAGAISTLLDLGKLERALNDKQPCNHCLTSEGYGGNEVDFRRFLTFYTQVALDCLFSNRKEFQRRVIETRWCAKPKGMSAHSCLSAPCDAGSAWFRVQDRAAQDCFFADLDHWLNPGYCDWLHMLVQMVATRDDSCVFSGRHPAVWDTLAVEKRVTELP
jgi:hypothetical protein